MAKVTYRPGDGDPASVTWGGKTFEANKSVEVDNPAMIAKAQGNPQFEVSGVTKEQQRQAEIVGGYADANTGEEVEIVRRPRTMPYGVTDGGPTGPTPPTAATQGSTATQAEAAGNLEEVFGAPREELASGEYEGAPEYVGPQGTEGAKAKRGRPPKK